MHVVETSNTQYDLGEVELVLAEVLNNIAEHDGRESVNHPNSLKWYTSDGLCRSVIDAGRCNRGAQSPTPKCPIRKQKLTICLKAALVGHWWIFCAPKCTQKDAGRSIPCASIFQKNYTAPKNPYVALKFVASLGEYYSHKPHNWLF